MIISDTHRYLFVELPRSGSTAIANELCELYGGESILGKHSTYDDFLRKATPERREYFVFSCIRNPLDEAVSYYYKAKNDPDQSFSRLESAPLLTQLVHRTRIRRYRFANTAGNEFGSYLKKFYKVPYSNWAILSHRRFDHVIRFESLTTGFSAVLRQIGLDEIRTLPQINTTAGRSDDFAAHYTPAIERHAAFVFGPFMEAWDYELPVGWDRTTSSLTSRVAYHLVNVPRRLYWRYIRRFARKYGAPPDRSSN